MRYLVTGGGGFIGSHLVDALLAIDTTDLVRVLDNFSSGRREHLRKHEGDSRLEIIVVDLLDLDNVTPTMAEIDVVFHLAANPDARWGIENTRLDLEQETIATFNVLESMRRTGTSRIVFSSSGTVYGDIGTEVSVETLGPCLPVSLYGAGKLASEGLISAFCGTFSMAAIIFRFGNIVGERTTHGVIFDFIRKLCQNPSILQVLGNGNQAKPYVYVRDLVSALIYGDVLVRVLPNSTFDVFNIAPPGATTVRFIAETLVRKLQLPSCSIQYGSTPGGWAGDVAQSRMDSSKLASAGFPLARGSDDAVECAIDRIVAWLGQSPHEAGDLRLPDSVNHDLTR